MNYSKLALAPIVLAITLLASPAWAANLGDCDKCDMEPTDAQRENCVCPGKTPPVKPVMKDCERTGEKVLAYLWKKKDCEPDPIPPKHKKPPPAEVICIADHNEVLSGDKTRCDCVPRHERFPAIGGSCVRKCERGFERNSAGICKDPEKCNDVCATDGHTKMDGHMLTIKGLFGDLYWWLVFIGVSIWLIFFGWCIRVNELMDRLRKHVKTVQAEKRAKKADRAEKAAVEREQAERSAETYPPAPPAPAPAVTNEPATEEVHEAGGTVTGTDIQDQAQAKAAADAKKTADERAAETQAAAGDDGAWPNQRDEIGNDLPPKAARDAAPQADLEDEEEEATSGGPAPLLSLDDLGGFGTPRAAEPPAATEGSGKKAKGRPSME